MINLLSKRTFEPLERIEFGFVLLPNDAVVRTIKHMSDTVHFFLKECPQREILPVH